MNDVQVLNATYPWLFKQNYTYTEFASVDLATVARPSGNFTFNDITVRYSVYEEHGIVWSLMQGKDNEQILILMAYSSSTAPTPHRLLLESSVTVAARMNTEFAHAYLIKYETSIALQVDAKIWKKIEWIIWRIIRLQNAFQRVRTCSSISTLE
jgi:hypothetical protein